MDRDELIAAIKDAAYLEGDFVLRSGKRSTYYLDKYLFETQPGILAELGRLLAQRVTDRTNRIAGAELGGVPLAGATVERIVAVIDRQEGGRQNVEAEGLTFEALFTAANLGVKTS